MNCLFIGTNIPYVPLVLTTSNRTRLKHIGTQTITARPKARARLNDWILHADVLVSSPVGSPVDSSPAGLRFECALLVSQLWFACLCV